MIVEWFGSQLEGTTHQRCVHVRVGSSELSSSHDVKWARHVVAAMVFGLSAGRQGNPLVFEFGNVTACRASGLLLPEET